jgi:hypothetical protein
MFSHAQKSVSAASLFLHVEIGDLLPLLEKLPTQGLGVSQLEAVKIQCSLPLPQNQMKAEHMYFFGKVLGVRSDYHVTFLMVIDAWLLSIRNCSRDCVLWFSLTETPTDWAFDFSGEIDELRLRSLRWPGFTFYACDSVLANYYFGHDIAQTDVAAVLTQKINPSTTHKSLE